MQSAQLEELQAPEIGARKKGGKSKAAEIRERDLMEWGDSLLAEDRAAQRETVRQHIKAVRKEYRALLSKAAAKKGSLSDSVGQMLKMYSIYPLLDHSQELAFARQIQVGEAIARRGLSGPDYDADLHLAASCKELLIACNMRLAISLAKKYTDRGLPFQDLVQEAGMGLRRAAEKFDPRRGLKFSTYAYMWCRQGITRAISKDGRVIRLPIHVVERVNRAKKAARELSQELGRAPTRKEIARRAGLSSEYFETMLDQVRRPLSFDAPIKTRSGEISHLEHIIVESDDSAKTALMMVQEAVKNPGILNDSERQVLAYLLGDIPLTKTAAQAHRRKTFSAVSLDDIAIEMGICKTSVIRIRESARYKIFGEEAILG